MNDPRIRRSDSAAANEKLSVLVVDDDEAMRHSVRRLLQLDGYTVDIAGSGCEMLANSRLQKYFAILLDRKLPDGDASEVMSQIRALAPDAAVLIVTGHADMESTIAAIRYGVDDYLIKPVEPETLRSRLAATAELYRVRQELRQSESQMRFLVENLPAGAVYVDHDRLFFNRAVEDFTGYKPDEIGTVDDWFGVLCGDHASDCRSRYESVREAGFPKACVVPITRKDGVTRELEIAGYRYDDHEIWLVIDVTKLHETQRRLVQSERLAAIGQMVAGLAHESRNALQRARGCLDLLDLDLAGKPEQLDLTARIRRSLGDLQRNYEEVKNYAAPINLDYAKLDAGPLVQAVFDDLQCEFAASNHRIKIHADGDTQVRADKHRLGQVIRNVLENAIAASQAAAEIDVTIASVSLDSRDYRSITISDSGAGMDGETSTRIFEPFYTTKQAGTGLGMAICKRIIDAHEGKINVTSALNQGASVEILLPLDSDAHRNFGPVRTIGVGNRLSSGS